MVLVTKVKVHLQISSTGLDKHKKCKYTFLPKIFSVLSYPKYVLGAEKNLLTETVLLSTIIYVLFRNNKIIFLFRHS